MRGWTMTIFSGHQFRSRNYWYAHPALITKDWLAKMPVIPREILKTYQFQESHRTTCRKADNSFIRTYTLSEGQVLGGSRLVMWRKCFASWSPPGLQTEAKTNKKHNCGSRLWERVRIQGLFSVYEYRFLKKVSLANESG